ncbi:uncharacterized protein LOC108626361 [Ceratina calcarata]|uniref:Uncharacterized protein LOC108626361 n=1 Tax=Ceratina calcarata TaxID=156304 RepID=A0AAJ7S4L3_9HYME|nr:uncharacterized protein LOC108626361 [Ceratina calcarata]XP_026670549.1 uncharacterized protein LOC108626361 [Ceratina calcarata]
MVPWAFGVPLILVSALGLILNGYVLLVVLGLGKQSQQPQTANTLLLIHLGAVEAAVCLILLIFTTGSWPIAGTWCVLHGFLLALLHPVALWTVTGLNCDRYYAIAAPLHYAALVSPRRVAVGLAASWTGALFLCILPFWGLVPPYRYSPGLGCCAPDFGNDSWGLAAALYGAVYAILGLALPAILVTVCNLRVLGIARYHRHRIASAIYEVTLSAQATITHQRNPFFVPTVTASSVVSPPRFHSAARTVMQLVGSLYLLYFPYCGLILWQVCDVGIQPHLYDHPKLASVASLLLACSPPINGLLYGLKSQTLRRSVQNYWRKKATKSELQQEIQARTPSAAGSRRPSGSGTGSFFPFPPLQRRLSEAFLALGTCRTGNSFDGNNLGFNRNRLQPAASCNTLRVPTSESGESKLVRSSASAASLMGPHYRSDFISGDVATGCSIAMNETPKRSPRILITRACSEESQDGGSPLLRKPYLVNALPCDKRRWRHCSTGSDSSTGSSEASIWTTGVAQKLQAKASAKCGTDVWPASRRFARGKNLEEGPLLFSVRPSNNSESSDTTDTTATTTTTTMASKPAAMENGGYREKEKEEVNGDGKKERDHSESENSWSSVDEIEPKEMADKCTEDDNFEKITEEEEEVGPQMEKCKQLRRKSKTIRKPEVVQDCKEIAQRRPLLTSPS